MSLSSQLFPSFGVTPSSFNHLRPLANYPLFLSFPRMLVFERAYPSFFLYRSFFFFFSVGCGLPFVESFLFSDCFGTFFPHELAKNFFFFVGNQVWLFTFMVPLLAGRFAEENITGTRAYSPFSFYPG